MVYKKRKIENIHLRFTLSFLLVLFVPIICFAVVFMQYFGRIFQEKIIEQAQNTLSTAGMELVRTMESLEVLVADDSFGEPMSQLILEKDNVGTLVKNNLSAKRVNHLILDEICYYNPLKPNMVYTSAGTYSLDMYAKIYAGLNDKEELLKQLNEINGSVWIRWTFSNGDPKNTEPSIQYIVKRHTDEWWIFTLNNAGLKQILASPGTLTIMENGEGQPVFDVGTQEAATGYEIFFKASKGNLYLSRYINEAELFAEFSHYQKTFLLIVGLLMIIGSVLVLVLTYLNGHPIREIQLWVREKLKNDPGNVEGMEIIRLAISEMEGQVVSAERRQVGNRLLLSMIYGHGCDTEEFRNAVKKEGFFLKATCFRVILAISDDQEKIRDVISRYLDTCENEELEFRWIDVASPDMIILIVGIPTPDEKNLRKELLFIADTIWRELNRSVYFYVGGNCRTVETIRQSYAQARLCTQKYKDSVEEDTTHIFFYEKDLITDKSFRYPDEKIKELSEALLEANADKVQKITDSLIEILRAEEVSHFTAVTLYYDLLNAYYKAQVRLDIDEDFELFEVGLLDARDTVSAIQIIMSVEEQYLAFVKKIQGPVKMTNGLNEIIENEEKTEKDELILRVIEFIEENVEPCDMSVNIVADNFGLSISQLSQRFKKATGRTLSDYITEKRFLYARRLLEETGLSVTEIALRTGYSHPVSFIRRFKSQYGETPMEYRINSREKT